ncbi:MAG: CDP-glucose 4,6-dehydratase [Pseudomonadota bacterium]
MDASFWQGKRVFVTGHTGFKGSWLSLWLASVGARVTGFALSPPTDPSLFELAEVSRDIHSIEGDIRDRDAVAAAVAQADPEIALHLAAQPIVRESYVTPVETFDVNVTGTATVLDALRTCPNLRSIVVVTSDKCYENNEWAWGYRERDPMGGSDPYSASKGCTELVATSFRRSFFTSDQGPQLATARAGNVIGGGDYAMDRLITDIMASIRAGEATLIRNPEAIRPWQHVLEPLHGYVLLAQALFENGQSYAQGWNFGPADEDARPVRWICDALVEKWGDGASWIVDGADHPHEATYLKLDSSKAKSQLGWRSKLTLDQALNRIVEWNKVAISGGDVRATTLAEISSYQSL